MFYQLSQCPQLKLLKRVLRDLEHWSDLEINVRYTPLVCHPMWHRNITPVRDRFYLFCFLKSTVDILSDFNLLNLTHLRRVDSSTTNLWTGLSSSIIHVINANNVDSDPTRSAACNLKLQ